MKIAVIGCGVMGSALAKHFAKNHNVIVCDQDLKKCAVTAEETGAEAYENIKEAAADADVILLAIKPADLKNVAKDISSNLTEDKIVMSILAGTSLATLKSHFPKAAILRMMPNLALTYGEGVIGLVDDEELSQKIRHQTEDLLKGLGLVIWVGENKIEALTALASSGPAFVFVIIESMIEAGIYMGFSAKQSQELVIQMIEGSVALIKETGKHPAELKWQIASPAGMTISGLKEIEVQGVRAGVKSALLATYERGKQMLKETSS